MIKIYDILFEEDTSSVTSSTSSSTSSIDPAKLGDVVNKAVNDAVGKPLENIQAYIKQFEKQQPNSPKPSNAKATTSTTGPKASGPSKPAGMRSPTNAGNTAEQNLSSDTIEKISNKIFQKLKDKNS